MPHYEFPAVQIDQQGLADRLENYFEAHPWAFRAVAFLGAPLAILLTVTFTTTVFGTALMGFALL